MSDYDITLHGGRVIDPETGLDEIADVAIRGDRIAEIAPSLPRGTRSYDVAGKIVSPGFIDIHAHGQQLPADRMQAFDGVTTKLECELGSARVSQWYDYMGTTRRALNYGAAACWIAARQHVMSGAILEPGRSLGRPMPDNRWSAEVATDEEVEKIVEVVRADIREGGLGIGILNGYAPGSGVKEMTRLCQMAAEEGAPTFTHVAFTSMFDPRASIEAYIRIIGYAAGTGAHMHICHLNSSSGQDIDQSVRLLREAQARGLPITTEAYPYGVGSTVVSAAFLVDPLYMNGLKNGYADIQLVASGRRFQSKEDLMRSREEDPGQLILTHFLDIDHDAEHARMLDGSILYPGAAIATDAMPWITPDNQFYEGEDWPIPDEMSSHPRSSGSYARFLRIWARERAAISWSDALAKCTLIPAQIMEKATPEAKLKGRLQPGMDADVTVFDPETIADHASFERMNAPSTGVEILLVNGEPLIENGELITAAAPGRPMRGEIRA